MSVNRREFLGLASVVMLKGLTQVPMASAAAAAERVPEATIDLMVEPPTLDPANVYDADGWSLVHSIYDSLVQFNADGEVVPLLAESILQTDPLTWEVALRKGITFHNGEPFDAKSVAFSVAHIVNPDTKSQVAWNFSVIQEVEEVDPHLVRLRLAAPAPWLPSQIAPWLAMLPPVYAADPANDFAANPVGTGPYK
ncbi:MAG: ABC transporter substrate-binding protein, partial [Chloroflexota bacterium]